MIIYGSALCYELSQSFDIVSADPSTRSMRVDYPLAYGQGVDLRGHIVLVPPAAHVEEDVALDGALCVCANADVAKRFRKAGCAVVQMAEGTSLSALYNCVQGMFVRFERLDARLQSCVDTYASFQSLLDSCTADASCPLMLIDDQYRIIGRSLCDGNMLHSEDEGVASQDLEAFEADIVDIFMASRRYRDMRSSRKVFAVPGSFDLLMKNIFMGDRLVGSLVAGHKGTVESARYVIFLLRYFAEYVHALYEKRGAFLMANERSGEVKKALPEAACGDVEACARLGSALVEDGHMRGSSYVVLRVERSFTNETGSEGGFLTRRLESSLPQAYCFAHEGRLYMLADTFDSSENDTLGFFGELPLVARENLVKIGMSRAFTSTEALGAAVVQADVALQQGSASNPTNWLYRFESYAFDWLIARAKGNMSSEALCHPALITLRRYDERHGSDLVKTLEVFMRCRYNATLAAEELFVARSTLLNRLERIRELTEVTLDDYDERLYLAFSFALLGH